VTKGKRWAPEEEKRLRQLLQEGKSVRAIAKSLGKTRDCVRMKIARLEVVVQPESQRTTTTGLILPLELPSVEDELKVLSAALKALEQPGLEQSETLRLRSIIQGVRIYEDLFADYVDYRGIEMELVELRIKYEDLVKKVQNPAAH
jgi:hypothetical protein